LPAKRPKFGGIQKGYVYPKTKAFKQALDEKNFYIPEKFIQLFDEISTSDLTTREQILLKLELLKEMSRYSFPIPRDYGEGDAPIDMSEQLKDIPTEDLIKVFTVKNNDKG
jgi:hypothetical protein